LFYSSVLRVDAVLKRKDAPCSLGIRIRIRLSVAHTDVVRIERYKSRGVGEGGNSEEEEKWSEEREHLEGVEEERERRWGARCGCKRVE